LQNLAVQESKQLDNVDEVKEGDDENINVVDNI